MDDGPAEKSSAEPGKPYEGTLAQPPMSKSPPLKRLFADGILGNRSDTPSTGREAHITTDLWCLACTAMLTAALWIPYIACQVMTNGPLSGENYVDPAPRPVPLWGQRAHRAYLNAVECFAPFAALVIVAQVAGKANGMTEFWAMSFFWLRLAHAIVYWAAIPYLRTVLFTLGFVCVAGIFWQVIK
ncbi:MAG TPA: MAPEG family protein [Roseiarcus sp.]